MEFIDRFSGHLPDNAQYARYAGSTEQIKTLQYTGNQIHDFAWFADKRFHVLKGKVKLPDSGREVNTMALFTNQEGDSGKKLYSM